MNTAPAAPAQAAPPRALQEGLFRTGADGRAHLLGSRCPGCGRVDFPRRRYCARCAVPVGTEIEFAGTGVVSAWSVIDRKSKLVLIDIPYIQAEVALPEGAHVFTVLRGCAPDAVRSGMAVECHVEAVARGEDGADIMSYVFRPAGQSRGETA